MGRSKGSSMPPRAPFSRGGIVAMYVVLAVALAAACLAGVVCGSSSVDAGDVWALASGGELSQKAHAILVNVRLPRVAAAVLAGAALAVSGALIQAVLDNPLASPNVMGINAGAGLAVLACSAAFPEAFRLLPLAAFCGALVAAAVVFAVAARAGMSKTAVVLAGVALAAVFGAGMNTVLIVDPDAYVGSSGFLVGGLSGVLLDSILWPSLYILVGGIAAAALSGRLNVLSLGDASAHAVGMRVGAFRFVALAVAALLAGAAVSFAGLLGFVGLIVPHLVRFFFGHDARRVVPASALAGAFFVVACDLFARVAFAPYEVPVGIVMAFLGGPFFIYLIMKRRGGYGG